MSKVYLQSPEFSLNTAIVDRGENLIKRCIIAIEGTHVCNRGKKYEMPAEFIQELGDNLNEQIGLGRETPLFSNHEKTTDSKFGILDGYVECRPVTEADLPNPNARTMLGKLALFGVAKIFKNLDQVRSGAIKALSPGIDMGRKLIFEVSAVPVASMPGVALFRYPCAGFSFRDVLADRSKVAELRDDAIEGVDVLIESLRVLERDDAEMTSSITAKQQSFSEFVDYMADVFGIPKAEGGVEYATSPWARETVKAGFSMKLDESEKDAVLDEVTEIVAPEAEDIKDIEPAKTPKFNRRSKRSSGGNFDLLLQGTS